MSLKEDILAGLTENEFVSGEMMAEKYYVSRNSVWKAVKQQEMRATISKP